MWADVFIKEVMSQMTPKLMELNGSAPALTVYVGLIKICLL